jgi:hypothetical protein
MITKNKQSLLDSLDQMRAKVGNVVKLNWMGAVHERLNQTKPLAIYQR